MAIGVTASGKSGFLDSFLLDQVRRVQERTDQLNDFIPFMRTSFVGMAQLDPDMGGMSTKGSAQGIRARLLYLDLGISSLAKSVYHAAMGVFFSLISFFALRKSSFLNQTARRQWEQTVLSVAAVGIGLVGLVSPFVADNLNWRIVRTILSTSRSTRKEARIFFIERARIFGRRMYMIKRELLEPAIGFLERSGRATIDKQELLALIREGKQQAHGLVKESGITLSTLFASSSEGKPSLFEQLLVTMTKLTPAGVIASPLSLWKEKNISFSQFHRAFFACIEQFEAIEGERLAEMVSFLLEKEGVKLDREELFALLRDVSEESLPLLYQFHQNGGAEVFTDLINPELRPYALAEISKGLVHGIEALYGEIDEAERELLAWGEELTDEELAEWAVQMKKEKEKALEELAATTEAQEQLFEQYRGSLALFRVSMSSLRYLAEGISGNPNDLTTTITSRLSYLETILPSIVSFAYSCILASVTTLFVCLTLFQNGKLCDASLQRWQGAGFSLLALSLGVLGVFSPDAAAFFNKKVAASGVSKAIEEFEEELEPDLRDVFLETKEKMRSFPPQEKMQEGGLRHRIQEKFAHGKGGFFTRLFNFVVWSDNLSSASTLEDFGTGHRVSLLRSLKNGTYHLFWGSCKTVEAASRCFLSGKKNREMFFHWQKWGLSVLESMVWTLDTWSPSLGERARYRLFEECVKFGARKWRPPSGLTPQEKISFYFAGYRKFVVQIARSQAEYLRKQFVLFIKEPAQKQEEEPTLFRKAIMAVRAFSSAS